MLETASLGQKRRLPESNWCKTPEGAHLRYVKKGYAARAILERAIANRDGSWQCFYCGRWANSIDHVTARYHGGTDRIENLVLACWTCNDEKNTTPGWLFALCKCWDYGWPDPFVQPSPVWDLSSLVAA